MVLLDNFTKRMKKVPLLLADNITKNFKTKLCAVSMQYYVNLFQLFLFSIFCRSDKIQYHEIGEMLKVLPEVEVCSLYL